MKRLLLPLAGLISIAFAAAVPAGGPLFVEGPNGTTPVTYPNPVITLNLDQGSLGGVHGNDMADVLVIDAIALWNGVPTSSIDLRIGNDMPVDVNGSNYTSYIPAPNDNNVHNDDDGLNPVVYDASGEIIDDFFGSGQSDNVIGFAASSYFEKSANFTEGFAVINGRKMDPPQSDLDITLTIAHEIGHFFGLDHSQADIDPQDGGFCYFNNDYPLMYPLACRSSYTLHPDDVMALSALYPAAGFESSHGQITGTFRDAANNQAIRGANIWVSTSSEIYSIVSDYLQQNTGLFSLLLPPGTYTLHANPVNSQFFGGSSVGPYAENTSDLSFQPPARDIGDVAYLDDNSGGVALLSVHAGEAVEVTFFSDGSGSFTEGNVVSNPNLQTPSTGVFSHDGSGSGSLSAWGLAWLLSAALVRVHRRGLRAVSAGDGPIARTPGGRRVRV